jgi:molybdate transport system substrate-binding protein
VIVCNPAVPCGAGAVLVFENSDADVTPASLEPDVRAVLTKIVADEADAGLVYRTDVTAAGASVEGIAVPDDVNVTNDYLIAVAPDAPASAVDFVDFVGSPEGQQVLASWGFLTP